MWTGPELATELGVTTRSVRRDVDRLRSLGYPVLASNGHGGGYQLGAGRQLPPLLLGTEEATAVAVGLRMAASSGIEGLDEQALRALSSLDAVLPPEARAQVAAVSDALGVVGTRPGGFDPQLLLTLARAVRDGVQVRVDYERYDGERSLRRLEPYRVLSLEGRWYLFSWDLDREDWRTFRLDRMDQVRASTFRFTPRPTPEVEAYVRESVSVRPYAHRAVVRILRPLSEVRPRVPAMAGVLEADGESACILRAGGNDLQWVAMHLAVLGLPVEVVEPDALREEIARLGRWAQQTQTAPGTQGSAPGSTPDAPGVPGTQTAPGMWLSGRAAAHHQAVGHVDHPR